MIIHMMHPQHGEMDVYSDAEVAANAKNGWSVVEIETNNSVITIMPEVQAGVTLTLEQKYAAKFGRKPHWKMKPETIEAALKE